MAYEIPNSAWSVPFGQLKPNFCLGCIKNGVFFSASSHKKKHHFLCILEIVILSLVHPKKVFGSSYFVSIEKDLQFSLCSYEDFFVFSCTKKVCFGG